MCVCLLHLLGRFSVVAVVNKLDPETKADLLSFVIVTVFVIIGVMFYKTIFAAVQPQIEPVRVMRDQFGHRIGE